MIDKDYAASMLAASLSADLFIILTGVDAGSRDFGKPTRKRLFRGSTWPRGARAFSREGQFPPAAWDPRSTRRFDSSRPAAGEVLITRAERLADALEGETGHGDLEDGMSRDPKVSPKRDYVNENDWAPAEIEKVLDRGGGGQEPPGRLAHALSAGASR